VLLVVDSLSPAKPFLLVPGLQHLTRLLVEPRLNVLKASSDINLLLHVSVHGNDFVTKQGGRDGERSRSSAKVCEDSVGVAEVLDEVGA
jgi:hypothetical protein